ncbi:MAG: ZIP family metal transporter [Candidatus Bathyarchaeota archaeon]|nr:MAG: ZIP family metal transporter [Candidatus Bathyarchaeota archaeon]
MNPLLWIIGSTLFISLLAWVGALALFLKEEMMNKVLLVLVALSAGGLIGGAFLHLLPEAVSEIGASSSATFNLFSSVLIGFCLFFVLEQFIRWCHEHYNIHEKKPVSYLVLISDLIHNFIDGLVVAGSFMVGFPLGVVTTFVIALHEIPQEIGDFGVMVYGGFRKERALIWNYMSAITIVFGGIAGYYLSAIVEGAAVFLLPFAAGNFIYIAASDLIPEIKHVEDIKRNLVHFATFMIGILIMLATKFVTE